MHERTIAMYCFLDNLLTRPHPCWARAVASHRRLTDAQGLTTALLVAARFFGGNFVLGQRYMKQHWG